MDNNLNQYIKDNIKARFVMSDDVQGVKSLIDLNSRDLSPISDDLALNQIINSGVFQGLGSKENLSDCFRAIQTKQEWTHCRGNLYLPEPINSTHTRLIDENGYKYINAWTKPEWAEIRSYGQVMNVTPELKDIQPFFSFMCRLFPIETERKAIYEWMARLTWQPHLKSWAPILKGPQGTGKSTFLRLLEALVGESNTHITSNHKTVSGGFNAIWMNSVLVGLEEVKNIPKPASYYNTLKTYVTDIMQSGERKGKDIERYKCFSKVVVATNAEVPFPIEEDDRRFAVFHVPHRESQQETAVAMSDLVPWIENNTGSIAAWLKTKLPESFDLKAPDTEAKGELIQNSLPEWEYNLEEYLSVRHITTLDGASDASQAHSYAVKARTVGAKLKSNGWVSKRVRLVKGHKQETSVFVRPEQAHILNNLDKIREELQNV